MSATLAAATAEQRLAELGLTLPRAPGAVAAYSPWAITGNLLITSGQLPWIDGDLKFKGRIGADLTPEQGYAACRLATLNAIAQLKDAVGDLERIRRWCGSRAHCRWRPTSRRPRRC